MLRGEIYHVNFGPGVGREPIGVLPAVVLTNDTYNLGATSYMVVPAMPAAGATPLRSLGLMITAAESGLAADHVFLCYLLRAVDPARVVSGPVGQLPSTRMDDIDNIIRSLLALGPPPTAGGRPRRSP